MICKLIENKFKWHIFQNRNDHGKNSLYENLIVLAPPASTEAKGKWDELG